MRTPWLPLSKMTYPGRLIAIGRDPSGLRNVVVYAISGRSPSSQARKLVPKSKAVWTEPTDPDILKRGKPELLVYPAILMGRGIAVSNGRQTPDIDGTSGQSPVRVLDEGLRSWSFEPDAPIFTPRISGCVLPSNRTALSIIRRDPDGASLRLFFEFPLVPGQGKLISTYPGDISNPLPSFKGEPLDVEVNEDSPAETAEAVYNALKPREGEPDLRVAVACVFARAADMADYELTIINREERMSR